MATEDVTRLVLVRHGESQVTVDQVVGGHESCSGLSDLGRRQAESLRDRLARTGEIRADALYASVLPRAVETAELLAPAIGGLVAKQDCDLCELHPGEADGLLWDEFREQYQPDGWRWAPYEPMAPGAETWAEFEVRVGRTLLRLAEEHRGQTVVVACHGGVIDGSMRIFLGLPLMGAGVDLRTENASITEWELHHADQDERRPPRWRLVRYNDAAHLADLDGARPAG